MAAAARAQSATPQRGPSVPPSQNASSSSSSWFAVDAEFVTLCGSRGASVVNMTDNSTLASVTKYGDISACAACPLVGFMAFVAEQKRRVVVFDISRNESITDLYFDSDILAVRINSKRLAAVCASHVHLFDLNTMEPLPQIRTMNPPNVDGLLALGPLTPLGECVLAVPQSADSADDSRGDVFLVDTIGCSKVTVVCAHKSRVTQIAISGEGNAIATCSAKGNVIRVFSVSGQQIFCFKRGNTAATIYSLALDRQGAMCACTSSSGTAHLFRGVDAQGPAGNETRSFAKVNVNAAGKPVVSLSGDGRSMWMLTTAPASEKTGGGGGGGGGGGARTVLVSRYVVDDSGAKKDGASDNTKLSPP